MMGLLFTKRRARSATAVLVGAAYQKQYPGVIRCRTSKDCRKRRWNHFTAGAWHRLAIGQFLMARSGSLKMRAARRADSAGLAPCTPFANDRAGESRRIFHIDLTGVCIWRDYRARALRSARELAES